MKTTICRKVTAILTAILTCISVFAGIGLSVSAAGTQTEAYLIDFPRAGETQLHNWGHGRLRYMNGWFAEESTHTTLYTTGSYTGNICYCIEPGTPLATGDLFTQQKGESFWDSCPSDYNKTISADTIKTHIGRILQYGYTGTISPDWKSQNEGANELAHAYATQLLIWETIVGERDEDFNHVSTGGYNAILDCVSDAHPLRERILAHYNSIVSSVKNHGKLPSFCTKSAGKAETVELEWDGTQYTATLTDTNNVLGNYAFSSNAAGIQFHSNGNQLTITAQSAPNDPVTITANKKESKRMGLVVWSDDVYIPGAGIQDVVSYTQSISDPVTGFIKFKISYGSAKIVKTSEDGEVDGIPFRIQGDASLAKAVYGIYKGARLVDTYATDSNGQFTTKYYVCGDDWSLREISASEGYLVTSGSEHIGAEAKEYTAEYNAAPNIRVLETVQRGKIALIKHCDNGETQIETPEAGAEFEVFLKSSGSYEAAKKSERDILVCDEFGFAESKDLPYGLYTVRQTKGWEGREMMSGFDVFISQNGQTYRYLINNSVFESLVEIVKKDRETGKTVPAANIGFKVRNTDTGEYVIQHINYPTPTDIDVYYTDSTGKLMLPEALPYGNYEIIEQNSCYGYVLDSNPVPFKVEGTTAVVTVEKYNMPQKGIISVHKSGEVFSFVTAAGGSHTDETGNEVVFPTIYQPVYDIRGLADAVYTVTAAEDIITPDGTLRYAKGTVVAEITTDSTGTAATDPLYLGKYEIREKTAPFGMIVSKEAYPVELTYAGQEVEITETLASFYNERQKAEISLDKVLSQDEKFQIGSNGEILTVQFGLFAAEDLTAADGSVIPADALLEMKNCDENGKVVFTTDIPVGAKLYVKEISTDSRYLLSDEKYPVVFDYAGQEIAAVGIHVNGGENIVNRIIRSTVKGLKTNRETDETIAGALFGLFKTDETEFTEETAILTAKSQEDGIFIFENVPYGNWIIRELSPAEGFLPNEELYPVTVAENGTIIEITVVNDRIPEIGTKASVDGEKEICATEVFTLTDTVSYKHLIPNEEYVLKGALMDKSTGKPLVINGEEIHVETAFTPDDPTGEATVLFTFDSKYIKANTDIVVFESLYKDGMELAVHADIEDEGQTVKVKVPEIGTQASTGGKKDAEAKGKITVEDVISHRNLTPGKEYTVKGILMDKSTGEPFTADGKEITAEIAFTPEQPDGEIKVSFTFDADGITTETELVVFERLYRDGAEIAVHADIEDDGQTVKLTPAAPDVPQTGDSSNTGFWIGIGAVALGGLVSCIIMFLKKKKDDDDEQ